MSKHQQQVWIVWSIAVTAFFFVVLVVPDLTKLHYLKRECTVVESSISLRYCCTRECSGCLESYPHTPLCSSLIERQHLEKNLKQCMEGNKTFCADEGAFCDGGRYCCDTTPIDPFEPNSPTICTREVHHRSCRLHCPTCYKSHVIYSYEKWCEDGLCRQMRVHKDQDCKENRAKAEKLVSLQPVGTRKHCWINPKDSQDIQFTHGIKWWKYLILCLTFFPALMLAFLQLLEFLIDLSVEWGFPVSMNYTSYVSGEARRVTIQNYDSERQPLYQDPPPRYSDEPPVYQE